MTKNTIRIPKYKCRVIVHIGNISEINELITDMCIEYGIKHGKKKAIGCALTIGSSKEYYIFFVKDRLSLGLIAHEQAHLVGFMFNHRRKRITGESEEFAELNEFLMEEFDKVMRKHKIKLYNARIR